MEVIQKIWLSSTWLALFSFHHLETFFPVQVMGWLVFLNDEYVEVGWNEKYGIVPFSLSMKCNF